MRARAEKKTKTKTNNSKTFAKFTKPTKPNTPIKQKQKQNWNSETDIEVGRVSFDAEFEVLGLNLAIELLGMNVWWKIYVHVHFLQSLVPFEHLLTWTNKIKTGKMKIRNMVSVAQTTVNWWERERDRCGWSCVAFLVPISPPFFFSLRVLILRFARFRWSPCLISATLSLSLAKQELRIIIIIILEIYFPNLLETNFTQ